MLNIGDRVVRNRNEFALLPKYDLNIEYNELGTILEAKLYSSEKNSVEHYKVIWDSGFKGSYSHTISNNFEGYLLLAIPNESGLGYLYDVERSIEI